MTPEKAQKILDDPNSTTEERTDALQFATPKKSVLDKAVDAHKQNTAAKPSEKPQLKGKFKSKFIFAKPAPLVSEDAAMAMIQLLFERYRIDPEQMQEDDLEYAESIETSAKVVLSAIMLEEVKIFIDHDDSNKLKVEQIVKHKSAKNSIQSIIYSEIEGNDNSSMPDDKKTNNHDKMYALLGSMAESSLGEHTVRQLRSSDLKTAHALASLFLVP